MNLVDLRSDTLTMPTEGMQRAMSSAQLGDDVFGEDPTINRLQRVSAELLGKEDALFVASGTMGNLLGVLSLARSGEEVVADADSHVFLYEGAGAATLGGIQIRQVQTEAGVMMPEQLARAIRPRDDAHQPFTAAVCVENTHNLHGGVVWPLAELRAVGQTARRSGLALHMDGARLFNAALALGVSPATIASEADTVTFCLSKGLGAPVGSVLCGPAEVIDRARRWRKMVGGGWREAGMLAAAGLWALENSVERLAEDHVNARTLAEGLAEMDGLSVDLDRVQTNIVYLRPTAMPAADFVERCREGGLLGSANSDGRVRFVTHLGVDAADVQYALEVCAGVLAQPVTV
ncbi:MAG: low-specificity L-threonine aldolase [Candidatus Dormibacteraeota bacterium]|nr:low-specificity L-threonine aldolase [Candidatus Dormibacteraeota bacterium]